MKRIFVFIILMQALAAYAQDNLMLVMQEGTPYQEQHWFYSGSGKELQEASIKEHWDAGRRITSAAYTSKGWFVTMAKNTGYTQQAYIYTKDFPSDWIKTKWGEGYYISTFAASPSKYFVVMSKGLQYDNQRYRSNPKWEVVKEWIKANWDEDYYITDATYTADGWLVVMSKTSKYTTQGYFFANSSEEAKEKIFEQWKVDKNITLMEYGNGQYFVVYSKYRDNNDIEQNFQINGSDPREYIQKHWDEKLNIAYIGGGFAPQSTTVAANTTTPTTTPSNPSGTVQTWREDLGYGMFAINKGNPNGARQRTIYRACSACLGSTLCGACKGTKICNICQGKGGIVTAGYGNYIPCSLCGMTGKCNLCKGSGKCLCTQYEYPGYMPGSTIVVGPDGQVIYNSRDSDPSPSTTPSSTPSSKPSSTGSCYKCHGTGVNPNSNSGGSLAAWVAYYNSDGTKCPYCSKYTSHYHDRCEHCNVPR